MKYLLSVLFLVLGAHSAAARTDVVCQSDTQLTLKLVDIMASPVQIKTILIGDNTVPNAESEAMITYVNETSESIVAEFVNLETASAFDFEMGKESLNFKSFTLSVHELGSPGSPSQSHQFSCETQFTF